jgi:hypothetical protein
LPAEQCVSRVPVESPPVYDRAHPDGR